MSWTMTYQERKEEKRLNVEFKQKYCCVKGELTPLKNLRYRQKSKKQRQAWWANLSDEDRAAYLERIQEKKAQKRRAKSVKLMAGKHFDCKLCIHGRTLSCTDNLPHGCEYYSNESIHQEIKST